MVSRAYFGLPTATLIELRDAFVEGIKKVAIVGQSHSISGRTFTHADLPKMTAELQNVQAALNAANGTRVTKTFASFRR